MMKKLFSSLIVAVFAVGMMAGIPSTVFAGQWNNYTAADSADADTYAVQNTDKIQIPTAALCYGLTLDVDLAVSDTLEATVGNAEFNEKSWDILDANVAGDLGPGASPAAISLLTSSTTSLTYRVTTDGADLTGIAAGADKGNFMLFDATGPVADPAVAADNAIFDLTGLTAGSYVSLRMDVKTNLGVSVDGTPVSYNIIEGINQAEVTAETASATVTIDVALEKKELLNGGVTTLAATYTVTDNQADIDDQDCNAEQILYTIIGEMSNVDTITGTGITGSDSAGDTTDGTAGQFLIDTDNDVAYAVNTALVDGGVAALLLNDLVVTFDADTVIPEGSFTIQATYLAGDADVAAWTLDPTPFTFLTLTYNGTVVYPGIVIGSGFDYEGGFRIVNRSTSAANIYFQVQNYDGAMLTEVAYSGNPLAAGATVYIPTDTVLTEGGLTTTSSANGIITVESDTVDIYQISYKSGGYTIVPLTKANNQAY